MLTSLTGRLICCLLAGATMGLSFAPWKLSFIAILAPAILLYIWVTTHKNHFALGFSFGLGMFASSMSWIFVSIYVFGETSVLLAVLLTSLLIVYLAIYPGLQGILLHKFYAQKPRLACIIGFPTSWVLIELLRSYILSGVPWALLGLVHTETPLGSMAPVFGVYGVSLLSAAFSGALVMLIRANRTWQLISFCGIAFLWVALWYSNQLAWTKPTGRSYKVALVQGNTSPITKFSQMQPLDFIRSLYLRLSLTAFDKAKLIIWPEGAIPIPADMIVDFLESIESTALRHKTTIATGIPLPMAEQPNRYTNGLLLLGQESGNYAKRKLLPFGDYVPFENLLRGLIGFFDLPLSSYLPGEYEQPNLLTAAGKLAPLICYEIAFPELVRNNIARDTSAILTISEDGWFGNSIGPHQHLQIAQMRARETGRFVLRATVSGVTAIINPEGRVIAQLPQFTEGVLLQDYAEYKGQTPWVKLGIMPYAVLIFCLFLLGNISVITNTIPKKRA